MVLLHNVINSHVGVDVAEPMLQVPFHGLGNYADKYNSLVSFICGLREIIEIIIILLDLFIIW